MSVDLLTLEEYVAELLGVPAIDDFCPNGVQVAGGRPVRVLAVAVSSSLEAIKGACDLGADALLVHHGLFWKGQPCVLRGSLKARVARLLSSDTSLLAYHLPLDSHPEFGHAACIARGLGVQRPWEPFGLVRGGQLGWLGELLEPVPVAQFIRLVDDALGAGGRQHLFGPALVRRVAVASGDCPQLLREAISRRVDLLLTGEETEWVQELAREEGVHYLAKGHYRTEVPGVLALGAHLADRFGLEWKFVDVPNEA